MTLSRFHLSALVAATATILPTAAQAAGPLTVASKILVETRQRAPDGTTRTALRPPTKVVPGDRVVVVLSYRNTGTTPLGNVVLANPLPTGLAYLAPADGSPAPELSVDGRAFGPLGQLRVRTAVGTDRPATTGDVSHVRWRVPQPVPAGGAGQFAFQAVLK